jgi:hypothetical protein
MSKNNNRSQCFIYLLVLTGLVLSSHKTSFAEKGQTASPPLSGLPLPDQGPMLSDQTGIKSGQWSLSFALPIGGASYPAFEDSVPSLGFWRMITDEVALGIFAGLRLSAEEIQPTESESEMNVVYTNTQERISSELVLSPSIKFYPYQKGSVALYFIGQTHLRFYSDGDKATTTDKEPNVGETYSAEEDLQFRARLGFGSEWFPVESFSIAGHIGLQLDLLRQGNQGFGMETFTSALSAQIYF